jgi:hypothetical protein
MLDDNQQGGALIFDGIGYAPHGGVESMTLRSRSQQSEDKTYRMDSLQYDSMCGISAVRLKVD